MMTTLFFFFFALCVVRMYIGTYMHSLVYMCVREETGMGNEAVNEGIYREREKEKRGPILGAKKRNRCGSYGGYFISLECAAHTAMFIFLFDFFATRFFSFIYLSCVAEKELSDASVCREVEIV